MIAQRPPSHQRTKNVPNITMGTTQKNSYQRMPMFLSLHWQDAERLMALPHSTRRLMEMCHEEVHRRFGFAHGVRRPAGLSDCQCRAVPSESVLRGERILTIGPANGPSRGFAMRCRVWQAAGPCSGRLPNRSIARTSADTPPVVPDVGFIYIPLTRPSLEITAMVDQCVWRDPRFQRNPTEKAIDLGAAAALTIASTVGSVLAWFIFR
jgi:hypothetical protein